MLCNLDLSKIDSTCQSGISDIVIIDMNNVKVENNTINIKRKYGKFKRVMYKYKQG